MKINKISLRKAGITISSTCRNMIIKGCGDDEIFNTIKYLFGVKDDKKHYPVWYRSEVVRKGLMK